MKVFKTHTEQMELLKDRGLLFKNEDEAIEILKKHNYYYLINGFDGPFKKENDKYKDGIYFEEILSLYNFNQKISLLVLEYILKIEYLIKSEISYTFSEKYGHKNENYLLRENFQDIRYQIGKDQPSERNILKIDTYVIDLLEELEKTINTQKRIRREIQTLY
ncbi:MAG: abortive infection bacteriophage resistance protein [Candidatus Paceibacteria bacterium]|jgi:abortive infection bacteriophage resistance protein